jgi:trehalose/maltose hydrolase-like predicted phosphorylase
VIGPDEYHEHIDDNAFTNMMARHNIVCALAAAALLKARWPQDWVRLSAELGLDAAELARWPAAAGAIVTGAQTATGLYEQFAGYFGLEHIDLAQYAARSVPMDTVLGSERVQASQIVKQADVVGLLALLPDVFPGTAAAANFAFYAPRCSQGSSLSRAMHGLAAARLGLSDEAMAYFRQTAAIDLADSHVAIDGGIHIAALGGLWLMAVFGFAGVSLHDDHLAIDPILPPGWTGMSFPIQWHGSQLDIRIEAIPLSVCVTLAAGEPVQLCMFGRMHRIEKGKQFFFENKNQKTFAL